MQHKQANKMGLNWCNVLRNKQQHYINKQDSLPTACLSEGSLPPSPVLTHPYPTQPLPIPTPFPAPPHPFPFLPLPTPPPTHVQLTPSLSLPLPTLLPCYSSSPHPSYSSPPQLLPTLPLPTQYHKWLTCPSFGINKEGDTLMRDKITRRVREPLPYRVSVNIWHIS